MRWIPIILGSALMLACIAGAVVSLVDFDPLLLFVSIGGGISASLLTAAALIRFSEIANVPTQRPNLDQAAKNDHHRLQGWRARC